MRGGLGVSLSCLVYDTTSALVTTGRTFALIWLFEENVFEGRGFEMNLEIVHCFGTLLLRSQIFSVFVLSG